MINGNSNPKTADIVILGTGVMVKAKFTLRSG